MSKSRVNLGTPETPAWVDPVFMLKINDQPLFVDLRKAMPITMGDWLELEKAGVVLVDRGEQRKVNISEPGHLLDFVLHFVRKSGAEFRTLAKIDLFQLPASKTMRLAQWIQREGIDKADDPS